MYEIFFTNLLIEIYLVIQYLNSTLVIDWYSSIFLSCCKVNSRSSSKSIFEIVCLPKCSDFLCFLFLFFVYFRTPIELNIEDKQEKDAVSVSNKI